MRSTLSVLILILLSISLGYSQTHELNKTFIEELENKKIDANQVRELKIKATNYKEDIAQTIPEGYQKLKLLSELKNLEKLDFQSLTLGYNVDTIITFDPETFDQIIKIQKNHSSWSPYIILPTLEQLTQLKELHMDFGDVSSLVKNPNKDLINDPDLNRHLNDIYWTIHSQNTEKELNEALKACLDEKGITPKRKTDLWNWIYLYDYLKAEENGSAKPTSIPYLNCFLDLIETNNEWKSYAYLRGVLAYLQHPASSIETLISTNIPPEILNTIQANNEEHFTQLKRDQKIYKDTKKMFLQKAHSTLFKNDIKLCEQWFLEILPKLKNLEVLSIKNNYSMEIEPLIDALKGLKKLKTLKIQSCRIEALPKEIKKLKKLELLDLSDNALSINSKKLKSIKYKNTILPEKGYDITKK